jgi:DNA-binding PadR family transcriptional regulator
LVSKVAPSGVVARVTLATIVLAPEPLTRYAVARTVEERFGGEGGILRTRLQHAYDVVPRLKNAGLIRVVGEVPTRPGREPTDLLAATSAGVEDWRFWLAGPITMPDAMTRALSRLYAVRPGDFATMLQIIDRYEATVQAIVQHAIDPGEPADVADRIGLLWNRRELVAQLQWCQHARDVILDEMARGGLR